MKLIDKSALVAEIEKRKAINEKSYMQAFLNSNDNRDSFGYKVQEDIDILSLLDTLEVKDPYEQYVQHESIEAGIKGHAETYSFNIESKLFNQLTKEQQKLWKKEIEQACISGGEMGVELARDPRYKENVELKEVDLEKHLKEDIEDVFFDLNGVAVKGATHCLTVEDVKDIAKHFFELGIKAQKK